MGAPQVDKSPSTSVTEPAAGPDSDATKVSVTLEGAVETLRRALVAGDANTLSRLLHERLTYSHSNGRIWTKHELLENLGGNRRYLSISQSEQTIDVVGGVGVVRHVYDVVNNLGDGNTSSGHLAVLQCWMKVEASWQLLARSGTTLPASGSNMGV